MSKTKDLKKGKYIPGSKPAPAKKAENNTTTVASNNHPVRDAKKEERAARHMRRVRSLVRLGLTENEILEIFKNESVRTVLCLYNGKFTIEDGTKVQKVYHRDEKHRVTSVTEEEAPNILHGRYAVEKLLANNNITPIAVGPLYCWIRTDEDHLEDIKKILEPVGRISVTKPEPVTKESIEAKQKEDCKAQNKANHKPSNNTAEAKKAAKAKRKDAKRNSAQMRTYYAALRKGGVSERIKKHNKNLAEKIEAWIKEKRKETAEKAEKSKEYRTKHRQLTSLEMKANKRARKAAKHTATQKRRKSQEKVRMENNAKKKAERAQKAQKPVQTQLNIAA